jgi:lysophospholipase L1-like esterase
MLRVFKPFFFCDNSDIYHYDQDLQFVAKKSYHYTKSKDYLEEYITNQFGTTNFQDKFADYKYKVFAIGDSYTQGIGLPIDASYPLQLDLHLNLVDQQYQPNYAVINLGLAAYGGEQYLITLKRHIKLLGKPDFILVMGCWNDYSDDVRFESFLKGKGINLIEGHPYLDFAIKPLSWLAFNTEIGKRCYYIAKTYAKKSLKQKAGGEQPNQFNFAATQVKTYTAINNLAKAQGATFILSWANFDNSYDWLKKWAAEQQIPFADWQPAVTSISARLPNLPQANAHSGGHYRGWVNSIMAQAFAQQIMKAAPPVPAAH